VRVHLAREHALELELFDVAAQAQHIVLDFLCRAQIALGRDELEQLARIGEPARQAIQATDDILEFGALLAEFLGALGQIPNAGLL
jgi:hypothetical protein